MKSFRKWIVAGGITVVLIFAMSISVFAAVDTKQEAATVALKDAGLAKSQINGLKIKRDGKKYEVTFIDRNNKTEYEYDIASGNGRILEKSVEYAHKRNSSTKKIGKTKALKAVSKFSGFKLKTVGSGKCRYKLDDGEWIYKVTFKSGRYKYEYEVQAASGKIIEFEQEYRN